MYKYGNKHVLLLSVSSIFISVDSNDCLINDVKKKNYSQDNNKLSKTSEGLATVCTCISSINFSQSYLACSATCGGQH